MELQAQPMDAYLDDQQQFANGMPDDTFIESSVSSVSTWTDFTNRYSWNWEPDCCLKIRKRWVPCLLEVEHTFWQFGMQGTASQLDRCTVVLCALCLIHQ